MHIYLIRHADPGYNGHDDLTKQGHLEAASLAERLQAIGVNKIYSSDKVRAIKTAQYTADLVGVPISIEPGLMEPSQLVIMQNGKPYCIWDTYGETVRRGDIPTLYDWAERS
ncbi:MAG: histidine phosphatase family protein, partial [Sphaerochaetaceae bacterium]